MEPVTHVLASVALARSGLDRTARRATPLLVLAGLLPDLDAASAAGGARAFLSYHRTITHSIVGAATLALLLACVFWWLGRKHPASRAGFASLLLVACAGLGAHLLLDLGDSYGARPLWPFQEKRYSWDLWPQLDPWMLFLLAAGLLLPALFRLIGEEIGARPQQRSSRGAILALALLALYGGARAALHARAIGLLDSRLYHGAAPLAVGAFPATASPFAWRGLAETPKTIEVLDVPLAPGAYLDPDRSRTYYKPESSQELSAARATLAGQLLLGFARFPLASVERIAGGYQVELRDLRCAAGTGAGGLLNPIAVVELDAQFRVTREELRFGP